MTTRRLAAILAADVVGFSSMMEKDEEGTLRRIKALQREVIEPKVRERGGRLVKTTGDGFLCEFGSPVEAVRCALDVQETTKANGNSDLLLRMGINLGDIIVEPDGDIYGEGVNVAARLEQLADPGGLCISGSVHEHAEGKVSVLFESRGEQQVKNIARPVRVYAVSGATPKVTEPKPLPLPDKPSIAVLPFTNMSGDPEQEFLADGMVEEIVSALSRVRSFFVISRNSTFAYKGRAVDPRQVGRELGVRYLVEGSVRRAGNRVRVMTQLLDASTGSHVWSERHDGEVSDIFDLQDKVTEAVVGQIAPTIRLSEVERAKRKRPDSLDAYDYTIRALPAVWSPDQEALEEGLRLTQRAISLDPRYALPKALASWCHARRVSHMHSPNPEEEIAHALKLAQEAASLDSSEPLVLTALSSAYTFTRDYDRATALIEKALALDPNSAWAWTRSGFLNVYKGHPELAMANFQRAMRLSPLDPMHFYSLFGIGHAHFVKGDYDKAVEAFERGLSEQPSAFFAYRPLTASYANANRVEEARRSLAVLLRAYPGLTISKVLASSASSGADFRERLAGGLRKAGLPQ